VARDEAESRGIPALGERSTYPPRLEREDLGADDTRGVLGQDVIPMTKITVSSDGFKITDSTIASGRNGITKNQSVRRMSPVSRQPP